jgi:hypothetical protein
MEGGEARRFQRLACLAGTRADRFAITSIGVPICDQGRVRNVRRWFAGPTGLLLSFLIGVVVASAATAGAASLITGQQIKNGTITQKDLSKAIRQQLSKTGAPGATGPAGLRGPAGTDGLRGPAGTDGSPDTAAQVRDKLGTVDGSGSGVDAATLDGEESSAFAAAGSEAWHEINTPGAPVFGAVNFQFSFCKWSNYGNGHETAAFFRDAAGVVHLKGVVAGAENNVSGATTCADAITLAPGNDVARRGLAVFVLPPGYRPAAAGVFTTLSNSALARIGAHTDGAISPAPPTTGANVGAWLSLSGISFRCAPSGHDGCP